MKTGGAGCCTLKRHLKCPPKAGSGNERAAELDKFVTHDSEDLSITLYRKGILRIKEGLSSGEFSNAGLPFRGDILEAEPPEDLDIESCLENSADDKLWRSRTVDAPKPGGGPSTIDKIKGEDW